MLLSAFKHKGPFDHLQETGFEPTTRIQDTDHMFQPSEVDQVERPVSPFVTPTKPYRPFSTEPIETIPPVEDPIILNPNYRDDFPRYNKQNEKIETIFKLPISPQYVPANGKLVKQTQSQNMSIKGIDEANTKIKTENINLIEYTSDKKVSEVKMTKEEILFEKQMNSELDIVKIEETASFVVDESLEAALTVTEEIKKEIDIELVDIVSSNVETKLKFVETVNSKEEFNTESIVIANVQENKDVNINIVSELNKEEELKSEQNILEDIKKASIVKNDISKINKNLKEVKSEQINKKKNENAITTQETNEIKTINNKTNATHLKTETRNTSSSFKSSTNERANTEKNSRLEAEQRAYVLGLQTIPNIRGRVQSGYHYDMLLKTFFIHLTDVMVALSRFILIDKPLSKTNSTENVSQMETSTEVKSQTVKETHVDLEVQEEVVNSRTDVSDSIVSSVETNEKETEAIVEEQITHVVKEDVAEATEIIEDQQERKSGSKMAQLTARKSEEFIQNMDAVVSEFQSKAVIDTNDLRDRRSRSKSRIEEEVSKESDSLEWLSKREINQTVTEASKTTKTSIIKNSNAIQKTTQHVAESLDAQSTDAKTYIAIVEAHVYTNEGLIGEYTEEKISNKLETNTQIMQNERTANEEISHSTSTKTSEAEVMSLKHIETNNIEQKLESTSKLIESNENTQVKETNEKTSEEIALTEAAIQVTEHEEAKMITQNEILCEINNFVTENKATENISTVSEECTSTTKEEIIEYGSMEEKTEESMLTEHNEERLEVIENSKGEILEETTREADTEMTLEEVIAKSNIAIITCEPITQTTVDNDSKTKQIVENATITEKQHNLEEVEEMAAIYEKKEQHERKFSLKLNKFTDRETGDLSKTPTPSTIPPTPLTDEYVFRLDLPLVESKVLHRSSPPLDHEDLNIVKKKLVPYIETSIERLVYDHPLSSPTIASNTAPAFPAANGTIQDEIMDIERKSSLLASAIDETIKSIEEYKEQVGIENEIKTTRNEYNFGTTNGINTNSIQTYKENNGGISNSNFIENNGIQDFISSAETAAKENNEHVSSVEVKNSNYLENNKLQGFSSNTAIREINEQASSAEITYTNFKEANHVQDITSNIETTIKETNEQASSAEIQYTNFMKDNQTKDVTSIKTAIKEHEFGVEILNSNNAEINQINTNAFANFEVAEESVKNVSTKKSIEQGWAEVAQQVTANTENLAKLQVQNTLADEISETGGTNEGIMNTMEGSTVISADVAKEIGKPGLSDDKIAELISGEAEMLREAHVMGLKRVIASHMTRADDCSVDFKKIKPIIENLKDSEVLKVLNEEVLKTHEEKKKEERKWTTFLQKPSRPVPKNKLGYLFRYTQPEEQNSEESYKVKIIKQPKPKVAPDYKAEDFETGPLPWEERAAKEPPPPPVPREDPILVPEELPEYIEAVDPLPESEVPDLEDTGIQLPKEPIPTEQPIQEVVEESIVQEERLEEAEVEVQEELQEEQKGDSEKKMADELLGSIQNMVDPNASLEQQLNQMRTQLAALAQLPGVIQQTLDLVTKQLICLNMQETCQTISTHESIVTKSEIQHALEQPSIEAAEAAESQDASVQITDVTSEMEAQEAQVVVCEAIQKLKEDEAIMLEEQQKVEKEKKELERLEQESRQIKQRATPRVGKPKPAFGPLTPQERPMVLPGGRKWRTPKDAYNEEFIAETLTAQAELIQGKTKGVNFMKYEKPPVSLDHLKDSDVYKMVHSLDHGPTRQVEMLTPVIAECDYREKCRSVTPCGNGAPQKEHSEYPRQFQP